MDEDLKIKSGEFEFAVALNVGRSIIGFKIDYIKSGAYGVFEVKPIYQ